MAKRKRLTPAQPEYLGAAAAAPGEGLGGLEAKAMFPLGIAPRSSPIAQVAGASAVSAALQELSDEFRAARDEGRLVQALPLAAIDADYLVRDRLLASEEDMAPLVESLRSRGQQTPIEVVDLGSGRFGLISGWRRLSTLQRLWQETGEDRFSRIQALLRRPESASAAYLAMVEENEIRVGLSYYERARIVARAAERGVFVSEAAALRGLFAAASRAKRSKIGSFLPLYHRLDGDLRFPSAIPERLGLALSKALEADPALVHGLAARLRKAAPETAPAEQALLSQAAGIGAARVVAARVVPTDVPQAGNTLPPCPALPEVLTEAPVAHQQCAPGVFLIHVNGDQPGYTLYGPNVDAAFGRRLLTWLAASTTA